MHLRNPLTLRTFPAPQRIGILLVGDGNIGHAILEGLLTS